MQTTFKAFKNRQRQKGSVLLMALVFLVLTALISVTIMDTSILEIKMAGNMQFKEEAMQHAEGVAAEIMQNYDAPGEDATLPLGNDGFGTEYCKEGTASCSGPDTLYVSDVLDTVPANVTLTYLARRLYSNTSNTTTSSEAGGRQHNYMVLDIDYNGIAAGLSQAHILVGIDIVIMNPDGTGTRTVEATDSDGDGTFGSGGGTYSTR